jgi:hypothetical protein
VVQAVVTAKASDVAIIGRFRTEEAMAMQSFCQPGQGDVGPDVNKSRNMKREDRRRS